MSIDINMFFVKKNLKFDQSFLYNTNIKIKIPHESTDLCNLLV